MEVLKLIIYWTEPLNAVAVKAKSWEDEHELVTGVAVERAVGDGATVWPEMAKDDGLTLCGVNGM